MVPARLRLLARMRECSSFFVIALASHNADGTNEVQGEILGQSTIVGMERICARARWLKDSIDDLIVRRHEQHRQHVVDGRKRELASIVVEERQIAEVPIGVSDRWWPVTAG